jgi:hypothetical protein
MTTRVAAFLLAACSASLLGACATGAAPMLRCPAGLQPMRSELLYFGSATPQGVVSADDWRGFVDEVVTPRFPDGLTMWSASGQWKSADGSLVREASWVLNVVHAPGATSETAIGAIADAYKQRFHQEAVLRVASDACVSL